MSRTEQAVYRVQRSTVRRYQKRLELPNETDLTRAESVFLALCCFGMAALVAWVCL